MDEEHSKVASNQPVERTCICAFSFRMWTAYRMIFSSASKVVIIITKGKRMTLLRYWSWSSWITRRQLTCFGKERPERTLSSTKRLKILTSCLPACSRPSRTIIRRSAYWEEVWREVLQGRKLEELALLNLWKRTRKKFNHNCTGKDKGLSHKPLKKFGTRACPQCAILTCRTPGLPASPRERMTNTVDCGMGKTGN